MQMELTDEDPLGEEAKDDISRSGRSNNLVTNNCTTADVISYCKVSHRCRV
jgi:hypothetical protein